jgi:lysophospholipase L1-like esterase
MEINVVYTVDQGSPAFEANRAAVEVVCCGDSLTGWNNFGPASSWPYRTYPDFLQELCVPLGLHGIANGGIAGEISDNGPQQVRYYLDLFPNARYFIVGMGTNDLGTWPDTEPTSKRIIANLGEMVQAIEDRGKQTILFNVPNVNEAMFPSYIVKELRAKRDYHNARLKDFCAKKAIPLADICSRLHDEHFGDELHPNAEGAKIIAEEVFKNLASMHKAWQELPP